MLHGEPSQLQISKTKNNSTFEESLHNKNSQNIGNIKAIENIAISKDRVEEVQKRDDKMYKRATPKLSKKKFKTLESNFKTSHKKSRIEVNLAFDSLK